MSTYYVLAFRPELDAFRKETRNPHNNDTVAPAAHPTIEGSRFKPNALDSCILNSRVLRALRQKVQNIEKNQRDRLSAAFNKVPQDPHPALLRICHWQG